MGARAPEAKIRACLFDAEGVLFDAARWQRWIAQVLGRLQLPAAAADFAHRWDTSYVEAVFRGQCTFEESFQGCLRAVGLARGQIEEIAAAARAQRRQHAAGARALPGVRATLERLRESGRLLAVACDADLPGTEMAAFLDRLGLAGLFQSIVTSIDCRQCFPATACYEHPLRSLGAARSEVMFIGHGSRGLAGAAALGLPTLVFNPEPAAATEQSFDRFQELFALVDRYPAVAAGAGT